MKTHPVESGLHGSASNLTALWQCLLLHITVVGIFLIVGSLFRLIVPLTW